MPDHFIALEKAVKCYQSSLQKSMSKCLTKYLLDFPLVLYFICNHYILTHFLDLTVFSVNITVSVVADPSKEFLVKEKFITLFFQLEKIVKFYQTV